MALILIILNTFGSFSISVVIPQSKISLVSGVMEAFKIILNNFHLTWLIKIFAFLVVIGTLGQLSTWIVGPPMGLLVTAEYGDLPPLFHKISKRGMPISILIGQGIFVTFLCLMFLFMPSINSSYWILLALTSILYLLMYLMMFAAAIYLRYSKPTVHRTYKIPGGKFGMWIVSGVGFLFSLVTFFVGFFPPNQFSIGNIVFYESFLILGTILMVCIPLIIFHYRKPHWKTKRKDRKF
jgi:amino acid transporter